MKKTFFLWILLSVLGIGQAVEVSLRELNAIPWKSDPPIIIDGEFSDWNIIPVSYGISRLKVTSKGAPRAYQGADDCSGTVKFAWRPEGFFLAAFIRDDDHVQQFRGGECFKGDHLELFLDLIPGIDPDRIRFGQGQYHIGVSPGNFRDIRPEVHVWSPQPSPIRHQDCAAVKTADGWRVEAFVAWPRKMKLHDRMDMELYLSDTDRDAPDLQKNVLCFGRKDWKFGTRGNMPRWILTHPDGKIPPSAVAASQEGIPWGSFMKQPSEILEQSFTKTAPTGTIPVLSFSGRWHLAMKGVKNYYGGYAQGLKIFVNGQALTEKDILVRGTRLTQLNGRESSLYSRKFGFLLPYCDHFFTLQQWQNRFKTRTNIHDYVLNMGRFWKNGTNTVRIEHIGLVKHPVELKNIRISWQLPPQRKDRRKAPQVALPRIFPAPVTATPYAVSRQGGDLQVELAGQKYLVRSRFSTPDGRWHEGSSSSFSHVRKLEKKDEVLVIHDTFTNLTGENLPIRQKHEIILPKTGKKPVCWLNGLRALPSESRVHSFNSTTFGMTEAGGIGIFPVSQVFRLHSRNYLTAGYHLGLCDEQFALAPGRSFTQTFAVLPVSRPDYWCFLNAARRFLDANFKIEGPFGGRSIVCHWKWSDKAQQEFIRVRGGDTKYMIIDTYAAGSFDKARDRIKMKRVIDRFRRLFPKKKILMYFHDQINTQTDLGDSPRVIGQNGQPAFYGGSKTARLFLPLKGTPMERHNWKRLKCYLDEWGMDGIFWDEYCRSGPGYHFGQPWDGVSADIDGNTGRIIRLKSLIPLLKEPVQKEYVDEIHRRGKFICANGELHGYALEKHIPSCAESEVRTNIVRVQLHSPVQYQRYMVPGMTFADHYLDMLEGLQNGVLFWWSGRIDPPAHPTPEYPTLTEHMFPITPLELHAGYILGEERIITAVSGTFGWNDASQHEVHVYDHFGMKVPDHRMRTFTENGKTWTDLRLAENYSAVIVRKAKN